MSVTPRELAVRIERDLGAAERVWVAPEIVTHMGQLERGDAAAPVDIAIVAAEQLAPDGAVCCASAPPDAGSVIAVLLLDSEPRGTIVLACEARTRASRVMCDHGIFVVRPDGLVIVELAAGVSARDLQGKVVAPLLISAQVEEMVVTKNGKTDS